jgi:hypothetical protein
MAPKKKGDGHGGPKPGTKQAKAAAEKAGDAKKPAPPEEPKKPSVKEVIGGASWTGKLPVNMLAEHCQKQKWEKPEYSMVSIPPGCCPQTRVLSQMLMNCDNCRLKHRTALFPPLL